MSAFTNYAENELIDHLFRGRSFSAPTNLFVALHTGDPGETGAASEVSTGGSTNYARKQYNAGYANWEGTGGETTDVDSAGTGGATQNSNQITFNTPGGDPWGLVSHFSVWDTVSGGNCLFYGQLSASKTINGTDPAPYFAIGDLDFTLA